MKQVSLIVSIGGFIMVSILLVLWDAPVATLTELLGRMGTLSYLAFVVLVVVAVVFAPVTVMPIIPVASMTFGPLTTALLSIVGWTLGAVIAFLIARHLGRPVVARFVSLDGIDMFVESLSPRMRFLIMVLARMTMPVEVVSYALGLSNRIGLIEYTAATVLGVSWFSFAFAYLGEAVVTQNLLLLSVVGGTSLLIFLGGWYILQRVKRTYNDRLE